MKTVSGMILIAGNSSRYGKNKNKNFEKINGKYVFLYNLEVFERTKEISEIIVVVREKDKAFLQEVIKKRSFVKPIVFVEGGNSRKESVYNGLGHIKGNIVVIQDCARPYIKEEYITSLIVEMQKYKGATIAVKAKDTIKIANEKQEVQSTTIRANTWVIQTPQCFDATLLLQCHEKQKRKP